MSAARHAGGPRPHGGVAPGPRGALAQWPLVAVLAICAVAVGIVLANHFRRGTVLFAGALVMAAGLRLLLPERAAGLLVVRSRTLDVITLGALGLGVALAALVVPPPS